MQIMAQPWIQAVANPDLLQQGSVSPASTTFHITRMPGTTSHPPPGVSGTGITMGGDRHSSGSPSFMAKHARVLPVR